MRLVRNDRPPPAGDPPDPAAWATDWYLPPDDDPPTPRPVPVRPNPKPRPAATYAVPTGVWCE